MGRTRSRPPRHVREASQAAKKIADATGTSEPAAPTQEQKPKLSQQQLALKWEMQWRPSAAQGTPYSYGKSCGGWVKKKDAKRGVVFRWRWSTVLPRSLGGPGPSLAGEPRHRFRQLSSVSGLGPSPAFAGKRTVFQELAKSKRKRKPVHKGSKSSSPSLDDTWMYPWLKATPPAMTAKDWIIKNFLILGLLAVITFGLLCPAPGEALDGIEIGRFRLPQVAVIVIFVVSGLCLDSISECLQYKALTLSVVLVLGVTPLLAYPILHYGQGYVEETLLEGLAVFCVVPTTLSSGVTMVTQAKGNVSLAVLLTTITNLLGVATMPWSVSKIFAAKVPIKPSEMLFELIWLTLVPLVVGMGLREVWPAAKSFAKTNKKVLGLCQNSCILLVVLLMTSSAQPKIVSTDSYDLSCALGIAAGIHLVYRVVGYFSATAAVLEPREWVTVVLMSSQKSLPVCVSVMSALPPVLRANSGLMIVPCIMAHASQLIIDSILAVRWEVKEEKQAPLLPS
ncbi:BASS4 [Symbiodinium necroappetens]|uniref:BASS4 protein n=1 Tax=Symbiodinium necroappetens TaxID=1628268 RepID=A0A812SDZ4_9DINO|nr:BASS4 [Symbiodinium necroappetens]